jgi:hypothetical protein
MRDYCFIAFLPKEKMELPDGRIRLESHPLNHPSEQRSPGGDPSPQKQGREMDGAHNTRLFGWRRALSARG